MLYSHSNSHPPSSRVLSSNGLPSDLSSAQMAIVPSSSHTRSPDSELIPSVSMPHLPSSDRNHHSANSDNPLLNSITSGDWFVVSSRRRNGLILFKKFYAEFAGPGAAVGGFFDADCTHVIPVGNFSMLPCESHEEIQRGFKIRRQWIKLTQQFTDQPVAAERAKMILNQLEVYFDPATVASLPDDALSMLVGILPHTLHLARRKWEKSLNLKGKTLKR